MSKFRLSKEITQLVNEAVVAFASRVEVEFKINKDRVLEIWNSCSEDTVAKPPPVKKAAKAQAVEEKKVQELLKKPTETLRLKKNKHGKYEHSATGFVFDPQTKEVFGKQQEETVVSLSLADIEVCKQLGFRYRIPETFQDSAEQDDAMLSDLEPEDDDDANDDEE
jgi:hypothetical protein